MDTLIACSKLSKRFRRVLAVDSLDLAIERGEVFGFLGPNGAGKSTTLRMMVGLIRPTSGSIRVFGHDAWSDHCAAMRKVGVLIEAPAFYKYLSGRDNLRLLANSGGNCSAREIDAVLDTVGLLDRAGDKVKSYSQGMRQRLGIALALVGGPELVLLDEPTNGLDPQGMKEVRDLIRRLSQDLNLTIFLSSHLLNEVEQVCTRIAVVNKGRVVESGSVSDLLAGSAAVRITVEPVDAAVEAISALSWASAKPAENGFLDVELSGGSAAELNRFLVERGLAVSALEPQRTSLEELYLKVMKGGGDAAAEV